MKHKLMELGERLGHWGERLVLWAKTTVVFVGMVFLIAVSISPIRQRLAARKLILDDVVNEAIGVAFLLTLVLMSLLYQKVSGFSKAITSPAGKTELIVGGVGTAYPFLFDAMQAAEPGSDKTLTVLGLTLATAWPMIYAWKEKLRGWNLMLYCLDPDAITLSTTQIPKIWAQKSQSVIDEFVEKSAELSKMGLNITLSTYSMFPGVFGFRLGNGDILMSFAHWERSGGGLRVSEPVHFYEWLRHGDDSGRVLCFRQLFESWTSAAAEFVVRRIGADGKQEVVGQARNLSIGELPRSGKVAA